MNQTIFFMGVMVPSKQEKYGKKKCKESCNKYTYTEISTLKNVELCDKYMTTYVSIKVA